MPFPSTWLTCPAPTHPSPSPQPCARGPGAIQALLAVRKAPGRSRRAIQGEGRVQTSCGRSLQPAPALALAFLQADVNARHCEVVRALVRLNKVPEKQAASEEFPRHPSSFKDAKKPLSGRATASQLVSTPRGAPGSRGYTPEPRHTEGPLPHRSVLPGSTCPL